ncbi:MAG: phosphatase PAP2 family protein [Patescibacteria group bacterium]
METTIVNFFYSLSFGQPVVTFLVVFFAVVLIWLMCLVYIFLVVRRKTGIISDLMSGLWGAGLFYGILSAINFFWFRPRPFVSLDFSPLVNMSPLSSSFPSGHAGLAWLLAYLLAKHQPKLGWLFYILASVVALARVAAGVHYFSDIIGGAVLGLLSGQIAWLIKEKIDKFNNKK